MKVLGKVVCTALLYLSSFSGVTGRGVPSESTGNNIDRHLQTSDMEVTGFQLFSAISMEPLMTLASGSVNIINIAQFNDGLGEELTLVPITTGTSSIATIVYTRDSNANFNRLQDETPFALCGSTKTGLNSCGFLRVGLDARTYIAEPMNRSNEVGISGSVTVSFVDEPDTGNPPATPALPTSAPSPKTNAPVGSPSSGGQMAITGFELYSALSMEPLMTLASNSVNIINIAQFNGLAEALTILPITTGTSSIATIIYTRESNANFNRLQDESPFALCGSTKTGLNSCGFLRVGLDARTYIAEPMNSSNEAGISAFVTVTFVDGPVTATNPPVVTPTLPTTPVPPTTSPANAPVTVIPPSNEQMAVTVIGFELFSTISQESLMTLDDGSVNVINIAQFNGLADDVTLVPITSGTSSIDRVDYTRATNAKFSRSQSTAPWPVCGGSTANGYNSCGFFRVGLDPRTYIATPFNSNNEAGISASVTVEFFDAPVATPVLSPVAAPIASPIASPVAAPVASPVTAPVTTPSGPGPTVVAPDITFYALNLNVFEYTEIVDGVTSVSADDFGIGGIAIEVRINNGVKVDSIVFDNGRSDKNAQYFRCGTFNACSDLKDGTIELSATAISGDVTFPTVYATLSFRRNAFIEENGVVVMEAETIRNEIVDTADEPNYWTYETTPNPDYDGDFFGSGYMLFNSGMADEFGFKARSPISYFVKITKPGDYNFYINHLKDGIAGDQDNDCLVRLQDGVGYAGNKNTKMFLSGKRQIWRFFTRQEFEERGFDPYYTFPSAGVYEFIISGRSDRYRMDRIVLIHQDKATSDAAILAQQSGPESAYASALLPIPPPPSMEPSGDEE